MINGMRGESADGRGQKQHQYSQSWLILALIATESATQKLACTVTAGAALKPQTKLHVWHIFRYFPRLKEANNKIIVLAITSSYFVHVHSTYENEKNLL